jgi:hypothetical protein
MAAAFDDFAAASPDAIDLCIATGKDVVVECIVPIAASES